MLVRDLVGAFLIQTWRSSELRVLKREQERQRMCVGEKEL